MVEKKILASSDLKDLEFKLLHDLTKLQVTKYRPFYL